MEKKDKDSKKKKKLLKPKVRMMLYEFRSKSLELKGTPFKKPGWTNPNCTFRGSQRTWPPLKQILITEDYSKVPPNIATCKFPFTPFTFKTLSFTNNRQRHEHRSIISSFVSSKEILRFNWLCGT
jgi:hypothetical protein